MELLHSLTGLVLRNIRMFQAREMFKKFMLNYMLYRKEHIKNYTTIHVNAVNYGKAHQVTLLR